MVSTTDMDSIYREYSGTVKAFLIRISGNAELAEELTQETFYRAIKSINRFDGKSSLSTWLCSIAKHLYLDAIRKQKNAPAAFEDRCVEEDFTERMIYIMKMIRQSPPHSAYYKGIEDAYRKLGLRSQINTILKPALERSLQRGTHW